MIFDPMKKYDYEELIFCQDRASNLRAIIAIHDTTLGPAAGGIRRMVYESEGAAIEDALRLSRAMTYKFAVSGCNIGGGKVVMMVDSPEDKTEAAYRSLGQYIESLKGRIFVGDDVGTSSRELEFMRTETRYVAGIPDESLGRTGPSPQTAYGVTQGIRACLNEVFGSPEISGKKICVQGLGSVGSVLVHELYKQGANIFITDIDQGKVRQLLGEIKAKAVEPDEIYDMECDVFSPCALGGIVNDHTIPRLRCKIIAGSANNQLLEDRHGDMLQERNILYAPDFVINSGGAVYEVDFIENVQPNPKRARERVSRIYHYVAKAIEIAKRDSTSTHRAAEVMAEERIRAVKQIRKIMTKTFAQY